MTATGTGIARRILDGVDTLREVFEPSKVGRREGGVQDVLEHLHNLAPTTFPAPPTFGGGVIESPVIDAITYMKKASLEMLSVHDSYVPLCLRDMYKAFLLSRDQEKCRSMSVVFNMMHQSRIRLLFYKDIAQLASGMVTSKVPRLLPLDRGIRSMDISINDVFNEINYRTRNSGGDMFTANADASRPENPYVRMLRNLILEGLREPYRLILEGLREFTGNTDKRLFKEHATYDDTDRALLEAYATSAAEHSSDSWPPTIPKKWSPPPPSIEQSAAVSDTVVTIDDCNAVSEGTHRVESQQSRVANNNYFHEENRAAKSATTTVVDTAAALTEHVVSTLPANRIVDQYASSMSPLAPKSEETTVNNDQQRRIRRDIRHRRRRKPRSASSSSADDDATRSENDSLDRTVQRNVNDTEPCGGGATKRRKVIAEAATVTMPSVNDDSNEMRSWLQQELPEQSRQQPPPQLQFSSLFDNAQQLAEQYQTVRNRGRVQPQFSTEQQQSDDEDENDNTDSGTSGDDEIRGDDFE